MSSVRKINRNQSPAINQHDLEGLIGYNLKRAYMIMKNDFSTTLIDDELSVRSFSVLSLVVENPEISQSELSRLLGIERSGLVAIVDELEARKLLSRTIAPGDRRVQALVALKAGHKIYSQALTKVQEHEQKLLSSLTAGEKKTFIKLLKKVRRCQRQ